MRKQAFTLVEVLIAVGLMAMVLGVASTIFYTLFKSARKSSAIAAAKTEGAYALRSMDQMIRFATDISCLGNSVKVTRLNLDEVTYSLSGTSIASDSAVFGIPQSQSLTSANVKVSACPTGMFTCDVSSMVSRTVKICFVINKVGGMDVTDTAGASGVTFQTQVAIRNWGN